MTLGMPRMTSDEKPQKRYSLFVLAILLLAFAGVAFVFAPHSFAVRTLVLGAIMISGWLVRVSNVRQGSNRQGGQTTTATTSKRVGVLAFRWRRTGFYRHLGIYTAKFLQ